MGDLDYTLRYLRFLSRSALLFLNRVSHAKVTHFSCVPAAHPSPSFFMCRGARPRVRPHPLTMGPSAECGRPCPPINLTGIDYGACRLDNVASPLVGGGPPVERLLAPGDDGPLRWAFHGRSPWDLWPPTGPTWSRCRRCMDTLPPSWLVQPDGPRVPVR